ncbi:prepilin-type N-terminal cleavage/methylation domain-containing protein [bacterium]|nr:prepilin-type N-terminal cleavage/methylation domain-containing protein [bacterium]
MEPIINAKGFFESRRLSGPRSCFRQLSSEQGFTLIEVLIVTVILAVAILGMEGLQLYAINQIQRSDDIGTATMLAQDVMENLRALRAGDVTLEDGALPDPIYGSGYYSSGYVPSGEEQKMKGRGDSAYYVSWRLVGNVVEIHVRSAQMGFTDSSVDLFDPNEDLTNVKGVREYITSSRIF